MANLYTSLCFAIGFKPHSRAVHEPRLGVAVKEGRHSLPLHDPRHSRGLHEPGHSPGLMTSLAWSIHISFILICPCFVYIILSMCMVDLDGPSPAEPAFPMKGQVTAGCALPIRSPYVSTVHSPRDQSRLGRRELQRGCAGINGYDLRAGLDTRPRRGVLYPTTRHDSASAEHPLVQWLLLPAQTRAMRLLSVAWSSLWASPRLNVRYSPIPLNPPEGDLQRAIAPP